MLTCCQTCCFFAHGFWHQLALSFTSLLLLLLLFLLLLLLLAAQGFLSEHIPTLLWWWKVKIRPIMYLCLTVVACLFSVAVLWSEVTFFQSDPTISLYAIVIAGAGHTGLYFNVEVIAFITLFYLSFCTYRVIFQLRIFNFYNLVPKKQTDSARCVRVRVRVCEFSFNPSV